MLHKISSKHRKCYPEKQVLTNTLKPFSSLKNMNLIELILTLWSPSLPYQLCISSCSAKLTCILENKPFGFQCQKLDTYKISSNSFVFQRPRSKPSLIWNFCKSQGLNIFVILKNRPQPIEFSEQLNNIFNIFGQHVCTACTVNDVLGL